MFSTISADLEVTDASMPRRHLSDPSDACVCFASAGPNTPPEQFEQWKAAIADLASSCPNVVVKCGGVQMVNSGHGFEQRPAPIGSEELCEAVLPVST